MCIASRSRGLQSFLALGLLCVVSSANIVILGEKGKDGAFVEGWASVAGLLLVE